ncbi:MAG: GlxA family transcriptional regulator [Pseudomonadota bacterium]
MANVSKKICLLTLNDFALLSFSCVIDVLRVANRFASGSQYEWIVSSPDGSAVISSCGVKVAVDGALTDVRHCDRVIVFASNDGQLFREPETISRLQSMSVQGVKMGSVSSGSFVLANAGLLDGYRATIHWENLPVFRELYPDVYATNQIFEFDRDRFTCSGGTAALDMMLMLVEQDFSGELAMQVQQMFQHDRRRSSRDQQKMADRFDLIGLSPKLADVVELMQRNIEDPLSPKELAAHVDVSLRQLERLFNKYRGTTPQRYYIRLRLEHARELLLHTSRSGLDVAIASGFSSHSHFIKSYRDLFGITPHEERRSAA